MRTKLFVAIAFLLALPALGQTLGEITGRISDPSGAGIPDAALTLTSISTNAVRHTTTTNDGDYAFPSVPPGVYNVKAEHPGFKLLTNNNVEVQVQQTVRLDLTLEVGQITQSVEVAAASNIVAGGKRDGRHRDQQPEHHGAAAERPRIPEPGGAELQCEHAFARVRPGGVAAGRRSRHPVDLRGRESNLVRLFHARRREQHRLRLQYLRGAAVDRRHPGIQGANRRLPGRIRP